MPNAEKKTLLDPIWRNLNFFRVHLIFFTLTPLILSGIFYAGNGHATGNANETGVGLKKVTYVDGLFLCYSAMTYVMFVLICVGLLADGGRVTGLVTVK